MIKLRAGRLALCLSAFASVLALSAATATAAAPGTAPDTAAATPKLSNKVTFIGDSVTAGFGFCGYSEQVENTTGCGTNQEMENSWNLGDNALSDCAPKDNQAPSDACSNNNYDGKPWHHGAWEAGDNAPNIAYPFQIAARQKGDEKAEVSDWAMTGSTPADWDPDGGGAYGSLLAKLKNQYVGMTVGANPLLSYFTKIKINIPFFNVTGKCVDDTYKSEWSWKWYGYWSKTYSGPLSRAVDCLKREWNKTHQTEHLVNIYTQLLEQNDKVVVMGYYRDCSWSFGDWQPNANPFKGPASGNDCKDEKLEISKDDSNEVSQWDQATAVGGALNNLIHDAVDKAKVEADKRWPGTGRANDLVYTQPDEAAWENHQPISGDSWILKNDTWIHPNRAGDANLADTMTKAFCTSFGHWCDSGAKW